MKIVIGKLAIVTAALVVFACVSAPDYGWTESRVDRVEQFVESQLAIEQPLHTHAPRVSTVASSLANVSAAVTNVEHARGQDQIVLFSSRGYPAQLGRTIQERQLLGYEYFANGSCDNQRVPLLGDEEFTQTWVFVHGNQIPPADAITRGLAVYRRFRSCSSIPGPIRFVIWSWPSVRDKCRIVDATIKATRTDVESFYLGSYLTRAAAEGPVSIIGYSFGARIISGALHLSSGGHLAGYYLQDRFAVAAPIRVAFLAAATDSDGFAHGGRYHRALDNVDRMLLMNNSEDKALRFYWIIDKALPKAIGSIGMHCRPPHTQVQQYDWGRQFGQDHSIWRYLEQPTIRHRVVEAISH